MHNIYSSYEAFLRIFNVSDEFLSFPCGASH